MHRTVHGCEKEEAELLKQCSIAPAYIIKSNRDQDRSAEIETVVVVKAVGRGEEEGCGRDSRSENGHGEAGKRDGRAKLA